MENVKLRKMTAFAAALALAAQNGMTVISAADNADKVTSNAASEETVKTFPDIVLTERQFIHSLDFPDSIIENYDLYDISFTCDDRSVASPVKVDFDSYKACEQAQCASLLIWGISEGETTYRYISKDGTTVGTGKIKVVKGSEDICDPALVSEAAKPVKVLTPSGEDYGHSKGYILYDNGMLYLFENGVLKIVDENIKEFTLNENPEFVEDLYTLSYDGVLKINGEAVNSGSEKNPFTYDTGDAEENTGSDIIGSLPDSRTIKTEKDTAKVTLYHYEHEAVYSVRDSENTENYCFIKDSKPVTHVKNNLGIFLCKGNDCVLIQREDNTLWKYVIQTGEFARVDTEVPVSGVKTGDKDINNGSDYTVVDKSKDMRYLLGSDGGLYKADTSEKLFDNIASLGDKFGEFYGFIGFVQTTDGEAGIVYYDDDNQKYSLYHLGENFKTVELVSYQPYYGGSTFFVLTEKNEIFELNMSYSYYTPETGYVDISFSVTIRPGDEKYRYLFKTKAETETTVSEKEKYQTADIVSVMQYIFGMENASKESWMDLDGNGTINVIDLVIIKKEILKNF